MSNVLIGIIGVILFIGLALAGALILGDDFRQASSQTQAAQMMAQTQQVSAAVAMHNMKTGRVHQAGTALNHSTMIPRFIKSLPVNPTSTSSTYAIRARDADGNATGDTAAILFPMANNTKNMEICVNVSRETGYISRTATSVPGVVALPTYQAGCFRSTSAFGSIPNNQLVVFQRI